MAAAAMLENPIDALRSLTREDGSYDIDAIELPPGDDMGVPDDYDDGDDEEEVAVERGYACVVCVDNLPVVGADKYEKLCNVLRKIYSQVGTIRESGLCMPRAEDGSTKGFAFVEYMTPQEAQAAAQQTDGYKLDKNHVFRVVPFDAIQHYMQVPDEYQPPALKDDKANPVANLHAWLLDDRGRDQFCVRYADETEVFWNDPKAGKADSVQRRQFWTESFVQWSSHGYFLATMHRQGCALWGWPGGKGQPFQRVSRFAHPGVRLLDFSPSEGYIVSYSSHEPKAANEQQTVTLYVWDTTTGAKMREFTGTAEEFSAAGAGGAISWPIFKWAGGGADKYFARMSKNAISVYEAPGMGLVDKKSIKLENVQEFVWSPSKPWMSVYVGETGGGNTPARVTIIEMPSRRELRQKNLFSVSELRMFWHPQGDYLAAVVSRHTKSKKSTYSGFELFRTGERDIPIEVIEPENKNDKVIDFAWEPKGHRFAVIHGDGPRPSVSIYSMRDGNGESRVKKLTTLTSKACNSLFWSPQGRHCILAGLKGLNGQLEFYNVDEDDTMATAEHFMCTDIDWDPTGRFVATSVTSVHQMENGFIMWSFSGQQLFKVQRDRFFQFLWRPRPPALLAPEKDEEIVRNIKSYSKRYDEEDEMLRMGQDQEVIETRAQQLRDWHKWLEAARAARRETKPRRMEMRGGYDSDEEVETKVEEIITEEELGTTEEPFEM